MPFLWLIYVCFTLLNLWYQIIVNFIFFLSQVATVLQYVINLTMKLNDEFKKCIKNSNLAICLQSGFLFERLYFQILSSLNKDKIKILELKRF